MSKKDNLNMTIKIDKCIFKGIEEWKSPKNGQTYSTAIISVGINDLRVGCGEFDLDDVPTMVPVSVEASVQPDRFGKLEFSGAAPFIKPA